MFTKRNEPTSLLRYWTTRYLLTLIAGLILLGAGSAWWIKQTTLENRLNLMEYLAIETAERAAQADMGNGMMHFDRRMDDRARFMQMDNQPSIFITDLEGNNLVVPGPGSGKNRGHMAGAIPEEIINSQDTVQKLTVAGEKIYAVKSPILLNDIQSGWVVVMQEASELTDIKQEYGLLTVMLVGLALLGWAVIYFLTKRIVKPIQKVADAARKVREGDYDIGLEAEAKELEIHDLVTSFKEMANRLTQLEQLRAELLAGVTHDLKTPVTSISGLVQAVRDGVVKGDEREEFLDITLKEIKRLQTMIEDLLDFNALAAGAFSIRKEPCNLNELVREIGRQWQVTHNHGVELKVETPDHPIHMETDPLRLQQILINLLNNSYQAMDKGGQITLTLKEGSIDVKDTGPGIPEKEQPFIFERFFRGEDKKLKVRGLGLGLPFSRMLSRTLGADLVLKGSSGKGTTFSLIWND